MAKADSEREWARATSRWRKARAARLYSERSVEDIEVCCSRTSVAMTLDAAEDALRGMMCVSE